MKKPAVLFLTLLITYMIFVAYVVYYGPYPAVVPLGDPSAYKNTYIHVPIALASYALFTFGMIYSLLYLRKRVLRYAEKSYHYIVVGLIFATLTLIQGSLWAKESWGTYWNWDPRETGVLLLWLSYLIYIGIRRSIGDPDRMTRVSSAYAVAAYIMVPFSFMLPYVMPSLHPRVQDTAGMVGGEATVLLPGGIMLGILLGVSLAELVWRYVKEPSAMGKKIALVAILISSFLIVLVVPPAIPKFTRTLETCSLSEGSDVVFKGVVLEASISDEEVFMSVQSGRCVITVFTRLEKIPLSPPLVKIPTSNETVVTIEGHSVVVNGKAQPLGVAARDLKVLESNSVLINSILFSLTMIAIMIYLLRKEVRST